MKAHLHILVCSWDTPWTPGEQDAALTLLPASLHGEILRFSSPQERQGRILARLLLREGLARRGMAEALRRWRRAPSGRPFLAPDAACPCPPDFSCAHAPGLTATALGWGLRVGLDVEPRTATQGATLYTSMFSPAELYFLEAAPPSAHAFATLWTRKEALLKLSGRGLNADPARLDVLNSALPLHAPLVHPDYVCHAATDKLCEGTLSVLPPDFAAGGAR